MLDSLMEIFQGLLVNRLQLSCVFIQDILCRCLLRQLLREVAQVSLCFLDTVVIRGMKLQSEPVVEVDSCLGILYSFSNPIFQNLYSPLDFVSMAGYLVQVVYNT